MYYVKALKAGQWWDSSRREAVEVAPGDIVPFRSADDASFFGNGEAGEPVSPVVVAKAKEAAVEAAAKAAAQAEPEPEPKPKRRRKKDDADAEETASE